VGMKDIPRPQLLSKFGRKTWKSLGTGTYPKNLYYQKRDLGPLGVKDANPHDQGGLCEDEIQHKLRHFLFLK